MSYSEDRADSRSLTAVVLVLVGVAAVGIILYFAVWSPSHDSAQTVIVQPNSAGPAGAPGVSGATGVQGAAGAQGTTGTPGSTGTQGNTGNQGDQGAKGTQGDQGSTGAQGDQGANGATGTPDPATPPK